MSLTPTGRRGSSAVATLAVAGATIFTMQGSASAAASATGTANVASGTTAGAQVLSISGTGFRNADGTLAVTGTAKVVAAATTCALGPALAGASAPTFSVPSATKIVAKTGALATAQVAPSYATAAKLCFPAGSGWVAVPYTYAKQPVSQVMAVTGGPSYGGQTITVLGSTTAPWRSTSTTVTVDGNAATNVKVAPDGSSLSFTTPAGSGTGKSVLVKTPGFNQVTTTAAWIYDNAIKVTPAVVPLAGDTVDITGSGFSSLVVPGVWAKDGSVDTTGVTCGNVLVVSDTELTCDMPAGTGGAYSLVVGDGLSLAAATATTVGTAGSTLTQAAY